MNEFDKYLIIFIITFFIGLFATRNWRKKPIINNMKKMYIFIIAIILVASGIYGYKSWQKQQSRTLNKPDDKVLVSYNLDDLADIKVPQSFKQNKKYLLSNFYHVSPPPEDKFDYFFYKDSYINLGGYTEHPIILSLSIYDPANQFEDINTYLIRMVAPNTLEGTFTDFQTLKSNDQGDLIKAHYQYSAPDDSPKETVLVFTNKVQHYRLILEYWNNNLDDNAALNLLNVVKASINIKGSLNKRIQSIKTEFYEKYPEKKP